MFEEKKDEVYFMVEATGAVHFRFETQQAERIKENIRAF